MKNILFLLILGGMVMTTAAAEPIDRPVAMVKLTESEVVSLNQFKKTAETFEKQLKRDLTLEEKKQLLDKLISEMLLVQAAKNERITVTDNDIATMRAEYKKYYEMQLNRSITEDEFRKVIEQSGLTWDALNSEIKKQLIAKKYVMKKKGNVLNNIPEPTNQEIEDYYFSNQSKFVSPEMVRFKQIYINPSLLTTQAQKDDAKKKAQAIVQEIKAGASFDNYWEVYDSTGQVKIGTYMPGITRRDDTKTKQVFGEDFFNELFKLQPNQVSNVVSSKLGYHIIVVIEKIPFKVLGLNDVVPPQNAMTVKTFIQKTLASAKEQEITQNVLTEIINDLKKQAEIRIFEEYLVW
ncbi:MAG: peptidyl-prolyl cis-trans isomerase [Spirochaetales bacterium]|nr:peptidyl-prolyl cis-trans isomerase [Spirochaetales bacterium]